MIAILRVRFMSLLLMTSEFPQELWIDGCMGNVTSLITVTTKTVFTALVECKQLRRFGRQQNLAAEITIFYEYTLHDVAAQTEMAKLK